MPLEFGDFLESYEVFKSAYADLVAYIQDKPLEVLVEIENAFSHIAVALSAPNSEVGRRNLDKAVSHLQRATLDCYKLLWVKLGEDVELILRDEKKRVAVTMETGKLWKLWESFKKKSLEARKLEMEHVGRNPLAAVDAYREACALAWEILESVDEAKHIEVKKLYFKSKLWELLASALAGALITKILSWLL